MMNQKNNQQIDRKTPKNKQCNLMAVQNCLVALDIVQFKVFVKSCYASCKELTCHKTGRHKTVNLSAQHESITHNGCYSSHPPSSFIPTPPLHKTTAGGVFKAVALVHIQMSAASPPCAPVAINTLITSNGNFHQNI